VHQRAHLDGKRPVFIDSMTATFFFPYHVVRFLEMPEGAAIPAVRRRAGGPGDATEGTRPGRDGSQSRLPVVVGSAGEQDADGDAEAELEIDEDFLQRIRDI